MAEHRVSVFERIVHRVEDRIAERERLLAITIDHEETRRGAAEGATGGHELVFVVASDAFADALEHFSPERDRLVRVMPAREGGGGTGLRGSWLVFEKG